jgi:hypothetical protein
MYMAFIMWNTSLLCKIWGFHSGDYEKMPSSGMWRRVDLVWTDVSEERIVFVFRVEKSASKEPAWAGGCRLQSVADSQNGLCFMESVYLVICMSAWVFFHKIYSNSMGGNFVILSEHGSPYVQNHTFCWLIIFTLIPITKLRERKYTKFELLVWRMWLLHRSIVNEINSNVVFVV